MFSSTPLHHVETPDFDTSFMTSIGGDNDSSIGISNLDDVNLGGSVSVYSPTKRRRNEYDSDYDEDDHDFDPQSFQFLKNVPKTRKRFSVKEKLNMVKLSKEIGFDEVFDQTGVKKINIVEWKLKFEEAVAARNVKIPGAVCGSNKNEGSKQTVHPKRKNLSGTPLETKLEAIELAKKEGFTRASNILNIKESTIRAWSYKEKENKLRKEQEEKVKKIPHTYKFNEIEKDLKRFYKVMGQHKVKVTRQMVKNRGIKVAKKVGHTDIKCLNYWIGNFCKRMNTPKDFKPQMSKRNPDKNESDLEIFKKTYDTAIFAYRSFFKSPNLTSLEEGERKTGIIAYDEVPLTFELPSENASASSLCGWGDKSFMDTVVLPKFNTEKFNFTVTLSASAAGDKFAPIIIFQDMDGTNSLPPEVTSALPQGLIAFTTGNGWITPDIMKTWMEACRKPNMNVLLMDSCTSHLDPDFLSHLKGLTPHFVPNGTGSLCNPLEVLVIRTFTDKMGSLWEQRILDYRSEGIDNAPIRNLDPHVRRVENYLSICSWVVEAWASIKASFIKYGFLKVEIESYSDEEVEDAKIICDAEEKEEVERTCSLLFPDKLILVGDEFEGWEENTDD